MEKINCRRCCKEIETDDKYCRECGLRLKPIAEGDLVPVQDAATIKPRRNPLSDNSLVVLIMLFFVLGPLALPMLWRGKAFPPLWKWILTILVIVYTAFAAWLVCFLTDKWIIQPFKQLLQL